MLFILGKCIAVRPAEIVWSINQKKAGQAVSEFKGTPGEWNLDVEDGIIHGDKGVIAVMQYHGNINAMLKWGEKYCLDDARLLVASKDLLEACQALPNFDIDRPDASDFKDHSYDFVRAMRLARAAISKALGQP